MDKKYFLLLSYFFVPTMINAYNRIQYPDDVNFLVNFFFDIPFVRKKTIDEDITIENRRRVHPFKSPATHNREPAIFTTDRASPEYRPNKKIVTERFFSPRSERRH